MISAELCGSGHPPPTGPVDLRFCELAGFSANSIVWNLRALGTTNRLTNWIKALYRRRSRIFCVGHPDTLRSANNFAVDLHNLGEYELTLNLYQDTLNRRRVLRKED